MDRKTQDHIAKFICIAVGGVIAFYVLMWFAALYRAVPGALWCLVPLSGI